MPTPLREGSARHGWLTILWVRWSEDDARPPGARYTERGRSFSSVTEERACESLSVKRASDCVGRGTILFSIRTSLQPRAEAAFLPAVETGTVTSSCTTENPSFELNGALLSRTRVVVLDPLAPSDIANLMERALADRERGLGALGLTLAPEALDWLAEQADGDARRALTTLEVAAQHVGTGGHLTKELLAQALQHRIPRYDKNREEHFNLISAYHKALRGSDPHAALYWLARMIEGGEDPMYIVRRTIRFASEDVGLADPQALTIALAARDAYTCSARQKASSRSPRRRCIWRQRPKSNRVNEAWGAALDLAHEHPAGRCAMQSAMPHPIMKDWDMGRGMSTHTRCRGHTARRTIFLRR